MSANAHLTAVGKFSIGIAKNLEYPEDWYEYCKNGDTIITDLCHVEGTSASRELAKAVGAGSLSDMHKHKIDPKNIDYNNVCEAGSSEEQTFNLRELVKAGFTIFFRPNC